MSNDTDLLGKIDALLAERATSENDPNARTCKEWARLWGIGDDAARKKLTQACELGLMERVKQPRQTAGGVRKLQCYRAVD